MNKLFFTIIGVIFLIIILGVAVYFYLDYQVQQPLNKSSTESRLFEVAKGEGVRKIAKNLENSNLIASDIHFLFYYFTEKRSSTLKSGKYCLSPSLNIPEIFKKIGEGDSLPTRLSLSFPEGLRLSQIQNKLESWGLISNKGLEQLKIEEFKEEFAFLKDAPDSASLTGYLYPGSYSFNCEPVEVDCKKEKIIKCKSRDAKKIAKKFLSTLGKRIDSKLEKKIKNSDKSFFEIITMASLLEKEVRTYKEKRIAADIFWKRISKGEPLQSCATIAYALRENKDEEWTFEEMRNKISKARKKDFPYNTYKNKGLPPGPISNPGIGSIKAALNPKETDYKYFLANPETGETLFSKTSKEHNKKIEKYLE